MSDVIDRLLASDEPSIRLKVRLNVLGEDGDALYVLAAAGRVVA
jgi:hypothetical protein